MPRITLSMSDDLALVLRREARRRRESVSAVAREALSEHFGLNGGGEMVREVPFAGIIDSGEPIPAARMEEYLAEHWAADIAADRG